MAEDCPYASFLKLPASSPYIMECEILYIDIIKIDHWMKRE